MGAESALLAQSILVSSPKTKLRGKSGDSKAETSIIQSERSEQNVIIAGLEDGDMSDREVPGEIGQKRSDIMCVQSDREALAEVGEGEVRVIGTGEVFGEVAIPSDRHWANREISRRYSMGT